MSKRQGKDAKAYEILRQKAYEILKQLDETDVIAVAGDTLPIKQYAWDTIDVAAVLQASGTEASEENIAAVVDEINTMELMRWWQTEGGREVIVTAVNNLKFSSWFTL